MKKEAHERKDSNAITFIGIGAQRCGTTWMYRCLETHPEICTSSIKETPFFSTEGNYRKGISYYRKFFSHCSDATKAVGEFNPHYLFEEEVANRLHQTFPRVKILMSLRNPIEALYSLYLHEKHRGVHAFDTFEKYLEKKPEQISKFMYAQNIRYYLRFFDGNSMLIILYDDICKEPRLVMKTVYRFLGVNDSHQSLYVNDIINASDSYFLYSFARPIYWIIGLMGQYRWGVYVVDWLKGTRARSLLDRFFQIPKRKKTISTTNNSGINIKTRAWLQDIYARDILELGKLLDRDLSHWR